MLNIQVFPVNMVEENTYVVSDDTHEAAIIDCGALYAEERESILEYVRSRQLRVTCLLNTHGHFDHVLGCQWASDTFGVGVEIHVDELENYQRSASDMVAFLRRGVPFDCSKEEIQCKWENTNFVSSLPLDIRRGAAVSIVPKKRCYLPEIVCFVPTSAVATFPEEISKV